ncbi:MAG TPA: CHASE domain-containing protein, partial [Rubrobacteraceae bacterium]|nr:CHASE domain-containing protein [Rubrobacteraceae bacterium]
RVGRFGAALRSGPVRLGRHLRRGAPAYGVLLIALLLTALAWYYVRQTAEEQTQARFEETAQVTREAIERRTKAYLDAIFGARGLLYASRSVDRAEWDSYVRGIEPGDRLSGLQALGFAEHLEPAEREAYVRETRGLGVLRPDLDPGGERPAYIPLKFVGPLDEANQMRVNYDLYTEPAHKAAMDAARDSGSPRATGTVNVLTEPSPGSPADLALRPGFAVYLPVYREGEPQGTVGERRRALRGFVVGFFRWDGLLDGVLGGGFDPAIDFELYDSQDVASSQPLYNSDRVKRAGSGGSEPQFSEESTIEVAGREWSLYFATLPGFEEDAGGDLPLFVLLSGVAVSFLLFGITLLLVRSRTLAERASKDLEETNRELEGANRELEAFSYSVSHDLRAPLRTIDGFSRILLEDYADRLDEEGEDYLGRVRAASRHMDTLIEDLLDLSRVSRGPLRREVIDLSAMARGIVRKLKGAQPERRVRFVAEEGVVAFGDANLLAVALGNLLGNAFKFTQKEAEATIEFGAVTQDGGDVAYYVRDDGAGFDMAYADKLFGAFQRLHGPDEFEGTGIGLATVARIVHRHGGRVWAEGEVGEGATFYFTLGGGRRQGATPPPRKAEVQ